MEKQKKETKMSDRWVDSLREKERKDQKRKKKNSVMLAGDLAS